MDRAGALWSGSVVRKRCVIRGLGRGVVPGGQIGHVLSCREAVGGLAGDLGELGGPGRQEESSGAGGPSRA
jgi:hypothetical protein